MAQGNTMDNRLGDASDHRIRIRGLEFHLPGKPIPLSDVKMAPEMRDRLTGIGQEFTYYSDKDSTELAIIAAREVMAKNEIDPTNIGLIISAPTLSTSYGFEIPAIALKMALGLDSAECLNISQGCVGFLAAMKLAAQFLRCEPQRGDVLIVTSCRASVLLDDFTHGAFFWGDASAAAVLTSKPGSGIHFESYCEKSSELNWGAMRLRHGDGVDYKSCTPADDLRVTVDFPDERAQADYIIGEQERCGYVIDGLMKSQKFAESDISALFFPSIGKNRLPILLAAHPALKEKVKSDFRYAHLGGVDVLFFLDLYLKENLPTEESWYIAMTPAFTAQWAGVLLSYRP